MKQAKVLHYTSLANGFRARAAFDPARPTSLLYERDARRTAAPHRRHVHRARRAPRSTNSTPACRSAWCSGTCTPTSACLRGREARNAANFVGRNAKFGPRGSITTEEACVQAGGRFRAQSFGWMVHVNVMSGDPWAPGQEHMHQGMD